MCKHYVSIIMPNYNASDYIVASINSVLKQTYMNFELIIVDDRSTDNSVSLIKRIIDKDNRVKLICLQENKGAANARNVAIEKSKGKYIAFIDSDDIWIPEKLEKQISFMECRNISFIASYYDYIDFSGNSLHRVIKGKKVRNYWAVLKNCPGNSTIIYDSEKIGKIYVPLIRRRNDYLMWLQVIKKSETIHVLPDILVHYRIRPNSLSHSKGKLIKYHWHIYRKYEKLNIIVSSYLLGHLILKGIIRKIF